ncbi:MAG: hypothetical protein ACRED8_14250, partial [Caulobacteraceae bacterium]
MGTFVTVSSTGPTTSYVYDARSDLTSATSADMSVSMQAWEGPELPHGTGFADGTDWAANPSDAAGAMTYGPYTTMVPVGKNVAVWKLSIDSNAPPDGETIVTHDINDATKSTVLASRVLQRTAWTAPNDFEFFYLPFTLPAADAGDLIEIRTWFEPYATVKVQRLGRAVSALMGTQVPQTLTETWAATALPHQVGFADGGGWAGSISTAQGYLTYGPYVTTVSTGSHVAVWQMMIDD